MSTELAAPPVPGWQRAACGCAGLAALLSCAAGSGGVPAPCIPWGVVRGLALPSPGTPLVASAAPCSLCRSRSCTCLFLSGDTGTSSSIRLFGLHF